MGVPVVILAKNNDVFIFDHVFILPQGLLPHAHHGIPSHKKEETFKSGEIDVAIVTGKIKDVRFLPLAIHRPSQPGHGVKYQLETYKDLVKYSS